jgi:hypothetical protein
LQFIVTEDAGEVFVYGVGGVAEVGSPSAPAQELDLDADVVHVGGGEVVGSRELEPQVGVFVGLYCQCVVGHVEEDGRSDVLRKIDLGGDGAVHLLIGLQFEAVPRHDVSDGDTDLRSVHCTLSGDGDGDLGILKAVA